MICAGGLTYFTSAWISIRLLRHLGCTLPIQVWYLGPRELNAEMKALLVPYGVECIDATKVRRQHPCRILNGWELKPYAIKHCGFQEVLLLDADTLVASEPSFLFDTPQYQESGALFWPDVVHPNPENQIWKITGVACGSEPEFHGGQILINKARCWEALSLCLWYNEHSDFYYQYLYGDKETYHIAFRKAQTPYALCEQPVHVGDDILFLADFGGNPLFQHGRKWDFFHAENAAPLRHAAECWLFLEELRRSWNGMASTINRYSAQNASERERNIANALIREVFVYDRVGYDHRNLIFTEDGTVGLGAAGRETYWALVEDEGQTLLEISSETEATCRLRQEGSNQWTGYWLHAEKMPIRISPAHDPVEEHGPGVIPLFAPASGNRAVLTAAFAWLEQSVRPEEVPVFVEIGTIRDGRIAAREEDGWNTVSLGWYAQRFGAECYCVDADWFHAQVSRNVAGAYNQRLQYKVEEGRLFLRQFPEPIALLCLTGWDGTASYDEAWYLNVCLELTPRPKMIICKDIGEQVASSDKRDALIRLLKQGYQILHRSDGMLCLVEADAIVPSTSGRDEGIMRNRVVRSALSSRLSSDQMFTRPFRARVLAHDRGDFASLENARVLIYWPHGFGDYVFLASILPLLDRTNRYWITRFGDDYTSLFDGSSYIEPLYLGQNSPLCSDGGLFQNRHFGLDYDAIDGSVRTLHLPLSLYDACVLHEVDTVLWTWFPETHGWSAFPYHTKGRGLLPYLVPQDRLETFALERPLPTAINFQVSSWIMQWVEAVLKNRAGFGERKLCLISRTGYTYIEKNWGHKWREDMPPGKQREGEECRDFMRLLLKKDPAWMFLVMEDALNEGDDTVRSDNLNAYSYAQLFGTTPASIPFGLVLKALANLASLSVGVPTGPHHLCMSKPDLPCIGLWLSHLPNWYDEPKSEARHLISCETRRRDIHTRPGSFVTFGGLDYSARWLDTRVITGQQVMDATEELIY